MTRMNGALCRVGLASSVVVALLLAGCASSDVPLPSTSATATVPAVQEYSLTIEASYPHDAAAFTQGLEVLPDGVLLESTGLLGESTIRLVELASGEVLESRPLAPNEFGEGLTVVGDRVVQLTWQNGVAHTWMLPDLEPGPQFTYEGEGWGLCYDKARDVFWRSDGTDALTAHDPETFAPTGLTISVTQDGEPVHDLNELECAPDGIWANIWYSTEIIRIDPDSGAVTGTLDASALLADAESAGPLERGAVLNGIARDPLSGRWYLTGKLWPKLYEVTITPVG